MLINFIQEDVAVCHYCNRELDPQYDYSCISCTRESCDYCNQACLECDYITCSACIEQHMAAYHAEAE